MPLKLADESGFRTINVKDCINQCQETPSCKWYTHDGSRNSCSLHSACNSPTIQFCPECTSAVPALCDGTSVNKILIATGEGITSFVGKNIEILDLATTSQQCTLEFPIPLSQATGGLMPGIDQGLICGGGDPNPVTDSCHLLPSMEKIRMKKKRQAAASLVFKSRLLIAGGYNGQCSG